MYTGFYIDNFRCFKETSLEFSRMNIIIGENNSGKSSLLKSLLALKQTVEEPDINNLILSGSIVDLGNFKETVYFHQEKKSMSFGFNFSEELLDYYYFFFRPYSKYNKKVLLSFISKAVKVDTFMVIELTKDLSSHKSIKTKFHNDFLGDLEIITLTDRAEEPVNEYSKCKLIYKNKSSTIILENIGYETKGFLTIIISSDLRDACKNQQLDDSVFYQIGYLLLNQNLLEFFLKNIKYLNPINTKPQRIYFKKDAQSSYKEITLDKFANQVTNNTISPKVLNSFSKLLSKYGIIDSLDILVSKDFPVAEIKVLVKDLLSNIYDVGYGVSLQIPILFETFLSEQDNGNFFIIEQPEVHLHPTLQARFVDVLLGMGDKNSYLIETHSEHIVRMLQLMIKEKRYGLTPEEIKIYYFTREQDSFKISEHKILENGQLDVKFPSGFFDTSYKLTKSLMF